MKDYHIIHNFIKSENYGIKMCCNTILSFQVKQHNQVSNTRFIHTFFSIICNYFAINNFITNNYFFGHRMQTIKNIQKIYFGFELSTFNPQMITKFYFKN